MKSERRKHQIIGSVGQEVSEQLSRADQLYHPLYGHRFFGSAERFIYCDERFRPTWEPHEDYLLTPEHRRQLCVHLAAHAVVGSIGGLQVHMLAIPRAGVRSWTMSERKTLLLGKIWGLCSVSDFCCNDLEWDADRQMYVADRAGWEAFVGSLHEHATTRRRMSTKPLPTKDEFLAHRRREVRAQACVCLAGHIADGITAGMAADEALRLYDRRDTQDVGASDIVLSQALCGLLPEGEYENVIRLTEQALRRPEVWESVHRVAAELDMYGLLEGGECEGDIDGLLPAAEQGWPYGPGERPPRDAAGLHGPSPGGPST